MRRIVRQELRARAHRPTPMMMTTSERMVGASISTCSLKTRSSGSEIRGPRLRTTTTAPADE